MMALRHLGSKALPLKVLSENLKLHGSRQSFSVLRGLINAHCATTSQGPLKSYLDRWEYGAFESHCIFRSSHQRQHFHTSCQHAAGHSKWANIKHAKEANDRTKGQKASLLAKQIQVILSRNPETNPKLNFELGNMVKSARSNNIPNDVIERAIERVSKLRDPSSLTVFDGRGLSNTAILIECFSTNPQHTRQLLQGLVKKYGFNLNSSALDLFDHRGIVEVNLPESELAIAKSDGDNFSLDKYVDVAIEVGAEDVTLEVDSDKPYLQFTCSPQDLETVQSGLDAQGLTVSSAERAYTPNVVVPVSKEYLDSLEKLSDKLDLNMDVVKYHFNVELEGSS